MPFGAASAADAVGEVAAALGRTQSAWLLAAIVLHVTGQVCRGIAWHEVLDASWSGVSRRRACAWHVCGAGLTGVLSARGGDAVRIALARREIPGATCAALAGSLAAEGSIAAVSGLALTLAAVALGLGIATTPPVDVLAAVAIGVALLVLLARRYEPIGRIGRDLGRGAAVLRQPGRFARRVLPWQLGNRALRLGSLWCFLHAAGLPSGVAVVLAACASQSAGNSVPLPVANVAAATAALVVSLPIAAGRPVDGGAVAALALIGPVTLTVVGLGLSLILARGLLKTSRSFTLARVARELLRPVASAPAFTR